jgi:hypothetical protein
MSRPPSARMFPLLCDLLRTASTQDATKARVEASVAFATGVPCAVEPARPGARVEHGRDEAGITHDVFLGLNYALATNDRVAQGGRTFRVEGPAVDESGRGAYWSVPCSEVR